MQVSGGTNEIALMGDRGHKQIPDQHSHSKPIFGATFALHHPLIQYNSLCRRKELVWVINIILPADHRMTCSPVHYTFSLEERPRSSHQLLPFLDSGVASRERYPNHTCG